MGIKERVITGLLIAVVIAFAACNNESEVSQASTVEVKASSTEDTSSAIIENEGPNPEYHHYRDYEFSPYYNGNLDERLSPEQVDFSEHFLDYLKPKEGVDDLTANTLVKSTNFASVWVVGEERMGVLGTNYQRIDITFTEVEVLPDSIQAYKVTGFSTVGQSKCDLSGQIKLIYAVSNNCVDFGTREEEEEIKPDWCGNITYRYELHEKDCNALGVFSGIGNSEVYILNSNGYTDDSWEIADGYANNDFVGIWKNLKTGKGKKCIWGDYRLPYTFDFDIGDGEMYINPKYRQYGWYEDSTTSGWWLPNN